MARRRTSIVEPVADEVLYVPQRVFDESKPMVPNKSRKRTRFVVEQPMIEPFGGFEKFEVRTALIRAKGYKPEDAPTITNPGVAAELCKHMAFYDQEHMMVLALSATNKLLAVFEAYIGGTAHIAMQARHLIKVPLLTGAPAAIIIHNHPSGSQEPSPDDRTTCNAVEKAFECIGIVMLDCLVVASSGWTSVKHMEYAKWSEDQDG